LINPSHEGDEKSSFSFPPPFSPELFQPSSVSLIKTYPKIFEIESRSQESECRRRANNHDSSCHCSIYSGFWLLAPEFPGVNEY
jgi:hypothetical protein